MATASPLRALSLVVAAAWLTAPAHAQGITRAQPTAAGAQAPAVAATPSAQGAAQATQTTVAKPAPSLEPPRPTPLPGQPMPAGGAPAARPISITEEALNRIAPLTPEEVLEMRNELLRRRQAAQQPIEAVARPVRRAVTVDMSPTSAPEVVRVAKGQGSVVAFVDAAGRPWPVAKGDGYAPGVLDIMTFGANSLSIGLAKAIVGRTNMAVLLEGLDTPLILSVLPANEEADVQLEVRVPRFVPGLPAPVGAASQMESLNAAELMDFLLGTPPKSARALATSSAVVQAWQVGPATMIVRTTSLVAAPAWKRRQSSGTGVTVYEMPLSPVVTVAAQGAVSLVRIEGFGATLVGAGAQAGGTK